LAPATSLARLRKQMLDLVMSGRMKATEACRALRISRSRFYELRARYLRYGEAGLLPKPRASTRPDRRLPAPLTDQIIPYAIHHPTEGPRTIAAVLGLPRFGSWRVSHGGVSNVLGRAGLSRVSARLAAAEALSAAEGGPITERALRDLRAQEVAHHHIGTDVPGNVLMEEVVPGQVLTGRRTSLRAGSASQVFARSGTASGDKDAGHRPVGSASVGHAFKIGGRAKARRRVRFPSASATEIPL